MQEDVENKTVNLAVKTGKVSLRLIIRALIAADRKLERMQRNLQRTIKEARKTSQKPEGMQTVKELIGQDQGVSSLPIGDKGIRDFKRIANKYGVDFAIVKDNTAEKDRYTVFFKARDADAIKQVLAEYGAKVKQKEAEQNEKGRNEAERPSIHKKLQAFKEKLAKMPRKQKEKRKEQTR